MTVRMLAMIPKVAIGTSTGPYMKSSNPFPSAIFKEKIAFYFALRLQWHVYVCPLSNWHNLKAKCPVMIRHLVGSNDQADSSGFLFRIPWKSMERPSILWNCSLSLLLGLRSLKTWLLKKLSMKVLDQKCWSLVEK